MARVTQAQIARMAGVSQAAVSLVLSGRDVAITPEVRERILTAVSTLGYHPRFQRVSSGQRTGVIGYLIPEASKRTYFAVDIERRQHAGMLAAAKAENCHLLVSSYPFDGSLPEIVTKQLVDGLIVDVGINNQRLDPEFFRRLGTIIPYVIVDFYSDAISAPSVTPDDRGGVNKAVRYLAKLGHRHIGYFGPTARGYHARLRVSGFREALEELEKPFLEHSCRLYKSIERSVEETNAFARDALEAWQRSSEPVTAVVAFNDVYAIAIIKAANDLGLAVPAHLSVIGYDDSFLGIHSTPTLTSIHQPMEEVGRAAYYLLKEQLKDAGASKTTKLSHPPVARKVMIELSLVIRESTAPPRA